MEVHYYVGMRRVLIDMTDQPPRRGDEIGIDGRIFEAVRVIRHIPMCPPDRLQVQLELRAGDEVRPPVV